MTEKSDKSASFESWLFQRSKDFANDPHQAVAGKGTPVVKLEKVSNANNLCFWNATATHEGLSLSYGKSSTAGMSLFIAISDCYKQNPMLELEQRMQKKLNGQYYLKDYGDQI